MYLEIEESKISSRNSCTYHNVVPLVQLQGQITVRLNPFGISRVHNSFGSWSNGNWFSQIGVTRFGHPCDFWSKVSNVILFSLKSSLRHKDGKVAIAHAEFFDFTIKEGLNGLPNRIGPRSQNVASRDVIVFQKFRLDDDLGVPIRQTVFFLGFHSQSGEKCVLLLNYYHRFQIKLTPFETCSN